MLLRFFFRLREVGLPTSLTEYLTLLEALKQRVVSLSVDDFYFLSRSCLVKDERHLDRFDRVFGETFSGLESLADPQTGAAIPEEWLRKLAEKLLSPEEMAQIQALGGFDKLMERLAELLKEQHERHQGGNRFIGTAGTSPFGAYGYNPEGVRIGQDRSRHRKAVKVWDKREFKNLDDNIELGIRNIQVGLRRLRRFARQGAATELDLPGTISKTAENAGFLDLQMVPERHNTVKVLLLLDIGGSMDDHVQSCAELFSAARTEFKHLMHYYFHNCVYESLWKDNARRSTERTPTHDVMHTYPDDYKLIFVGDATMSPYEILQEGGSVEYHNAEPGATWLQRLTHAFPDHVWINPEPQGLWPYRQSVGLIQELVGQRMYGMTLRGLEEAMRRLGS